MPQLTEKLIRKRAEHNEGRLPDLEEVALHQEEIEKIENLERCCRHIKILLLQNNIIPKMEGLNKLHELDYLNLGLNNIEKIEGVERCESLRKLDLTVNFIAIENLEESVYNLKANIMLEDLYMQGNPCTDWAGFRQYTIAHLPQLKQLDGTMILPRDRILARQRLPQLKEDLDRVVERRLAEKAAAAGQPAEEGAYTRESRVDMYLELAQQKAEKDKQERERMGTEPKPPREVPGVYNARGQIRQCNEGKWDFNMDDSTEHGKVIFELGVPKYLETSQLDVDVNPLYVRVVVRDKVTQLKLPSEVKPDASKVQRSKITGWLRIDMPMVDPPVLRERQAPQPPEIEPLKQGAPKSELPPGPRLQEAVSIEGIYQDKRRVVKEQKPKQLLREVKTTHTGPRSSAKDITTGEDDDDDDVPPLEPRT